MIKIFSMIKKVSGWILDSVNYPHAGSEALMVYTLFTIYIMRSPKDLNDLTIDLQWKQSVPVF